ncbi:MAG: KTSC domain-containing protein [Bacteroidales bacterium]|nr:KTSC domain-containing protein [Bacteroidales bacterium]
MNTIEIASGIIRGCNYHKQKQVLDITTIDGIVYQYFEVPENIISDFLNAEKPGVYYKNFIRKKFRRLFKSYDYSMML